MSAPSTLGSFPRGFDWGNVRRLEVVSRRLLANLAAATPVLADAHVMAHLDIDSAQRRVYGHAKQGAGFGAAMVGGYTLRLRGLHPLLAAVSTPTCAPVPLGTRLRGGTASSARGAESFVAEAITTARAAGATGLLIARMDSAFYGGAPIAACRRAGVRFSVTARMDKKITKAIAGIGEDAWTPIRYPNAVLDEDEQRRISDAEVAEVLHRVHRQEEASGDRVGSEASRIDEPLNDGSPHDLPGRHLDREVLGKIGEPLRLPHHCASLRAHQGGVSCERKLLAGLTAEVFGEPSELDDGEPVDVAPAGEQLGFRRIRPT